MRQIILLALLGVMTSLPVSAASDYVIRIDGMTCNYCAYNVKKRLKTLPGVEQVEVDQAQGLATVHVKTGTVLTDAQLKTLIAEAGYNYRGMQSKPQ